MWSHLYTRAISNLGSELVNSKAYEGLLFKKMLPGY